MPVPALPGMLPPADGTPRATAPVPGQHTKAILTEHGFAPPEIATLLAEGVVAAASIMP